MIQPLAAQAQLDAQAYARLAEHHPALLIGLALNLKDGKRPADIYRAACAGGNDPALCALMWGAAQHMRDNPQSLPPGITL